MKVATWLAVLLTTFLTEVSFGGGLEFPPKNPSDLIGHFTDELTKLTGKRGYRVYLMEDVRYALQVRRMGDRRYVLFVEIVKDVQLSRDKILDVVLIPPLPANEVPVFDCYGKQAAQNVYRQAVGIMEQITEKTRYQKLFPAKQAWQIDKETHKFKKVAAQDVICEPKSGAGVSEVEIPPNHIW